MHACLSVSEAIFILAFKKWCNQIENFTNQRALTDCYGFLFTLFVGVMGTKNTYVCMSIDICV